MRGATGRGPEGFDAFVGARYPALVRLGTLLSGDRHHGEDIAQLGLVAVLRAWRRLHPDGDPEAYARVVMTRLAAKAGRRRWRGEMPTENLPEVPAADPYAGVDDADAARRLLSSLPAHQRITLVLRFGWTTARSRPRPPWDVLREQSRAAPIEPCPS